MLQAQVEPLLTQASLKPAYQAAEHPASTSPGRADRSRARLPLSAAHAQRLQVTLARVMGDGLCANMCQAAAACVLACLAGQPTQEVVEAALHCLHTLARCS